MKRGILFIFISRYIYIYFFFYWVKFRRDCWKFENCMLKKCLKVKDNRSSSLSLSFYQKFWSTVQKFWNSYLCVKYLCCRKRISQAAFLQHDQVPSRENGNTRCFTGLLLPNWVYKFSFHRKKVDVRLRFWKLLFINFKCFFKKTLTFWKFCSKKIDKPCRVFEIILKI